MNESKRKKIILENILEGKELSAEIKEHLNTCINCKKFYENSLKLSRGLKEIRLKIKKSNLNYEIILPKSITNENLKLLFPLTLKKGLLIALSIIVFVISFGIFYIGVLGQIPFLTNENHLAEQNATNEINDEIYDKISSLIYTVSFSYEFNETEY